MSAFTRPALVVAIALVCGPATAEKDCPRGTGALDAGVVIEFDGISIDYRREPDGRLHETERFESGETWIYLSHPSGLILEAWLVGADGRPEDGTRERYDFAFAGGGLPDPVAGTSAVGTETAHFDSGEPVTTRIALSFDKEERISIGACDYVAIPATETRTDSGGATGEPPWINRLVHLPELGLTIFLGGEALGATPDLLWPLSISAGRAAP